jgi:hypothetical protein
MMDIEPNKAAALLDANTAPELSIRRVTLVCKNHLDVGFTESAAKVTHDAVHWMLPVAIQQARTLREEDRGDNFVWTTPSWTITEALERHRGENLKSVEAACAAGDLAWHALPFSTHTELMDEELFEFGLSLSQTLDARFGRQTLAAKMTDVPGHTRGIIPLLAQAGVKFLHIGVNHMSAVPNVPEVFRWQDPETRAEIIVVYCRGYGTTHRLPNDDAVLSFRMLGDNMEVPSLADVRAWLAESRATYPNAAVAFGRMDDYAASLERHRHALPVVNQEIGDTWIHGVGTDPWKVARFREALRHRKEWLRAGKLLKGSRLYFSISKPLLMIAEHTWGVSIGPHLQDTRNLANADFQRVRHRGTFRSCEASWQEQRDYLEDAGIAAAEGGLQAELEAAWQALEARRPDACGFAEIDATTPVNLPDLVLQLDPLTGAIAAGTLHGLPLASTEQPTGLLRFQSISASQLQNFRNQYCGPAHAWAGTDFGREGTDETNTRAAFWRPKLEQAFRRDEPGQSTLLLKLSFATEAVINFGAPAEAWITLRLPHTGRAIHWDVQWFNKTASRLPESLWFTIAPPVPNQAQWRVRKMGQLISPHEIVARGGRKLHAIESITNTDAVAPWQIDALDTALVAPGSPDFINFDDAQPDLTGGWHFNLWNNVWGTNFPMWYGQDARFRFELSIRQHIPRDIAPRHDVAASPFSPSTTRGATYPLSPPSLFHQR